MTPAATRIERTVPAIRAVLAEHSPAESEQFAAELRQALSLAAEDLDLARVEAVLDRWWGIAVIDANPLTESEHAQIARARDGDFTGLSTRDADGNWIRCETR